MDIGNPPPKKEDGQAGGWDLWGKNYITKGGPRSQKWIVESSYSNKVVCVSYLLI